MRRGALYCDMYVCIGRLPHAKILAEGERGHRESVPPSLPRSISLYTYLSVSLSRSSLCHSLLVLAVCCIHLIIEILSSVDEELILKDTTAEISSLGLHRPTRPPALLSDIKNLERLQMLNSIMTSCCEDEREGEELNSKEIRLLSYRITLGAISEEKKRETREDEDKHRLQCIHRQPQTIGNTPREKERETV